VRAGLRAVLFDWDGTLVDSADISFRSYVALFGGFGISFGPEDFQRSYSPDWYRTYAAMGLPKERWDEADLRWLELYANGTAGLLPESAPGLKRLAGAGLRQGLVTSGTRSRVEADLARLGVGGFFDAVVCGGDTAHRKPHPEPLLVALERLGVGASEAAYLGDSPEDISMARAAGVFAVGIPGGFPNQDALRAARPDLLCSSLDAAIRDLIG